MSNKNSPALVTRIQRSSYNDGPGLRTTVFIKGCFFKCPWCHNPENINPEAEIYYYHDKCRRCGKCSEICPENAITPVGPKGEYPIRNRNKCVGCMKCVEACPAEALEKVGDALSIDEIIAEVARDRLFYQNSGGGMTVSGGEALYHPEFTHDLLRKAKDVAIHTCLDTTGNVKWEVLDKVLNYVDLVLLDAKTMDATKLKTLVGASLDLIRENALKMAKRGSKIRLRLPIIPDFNFAKGNKNISDEYFKQVLAFAKELGESVVGIDLLPFHNFAEKKYENLDMEYKYKGRPSMEKAEVSPFLEIFRGNGFEVTIGG